MQIRKSVLYVETSSLETVTHPFRFYNTFPIYNLMLCWFLYRVEPKGQQCPILWDKHWIRDCHLCDCLTCFVTKEHADGKFQASTQHSSRKIQICNLRNGALWTFWLELKLTLHGVISTKSVRELGQMSYMSARSSETGKTSFCKVQIFELGYSALLLFFYCLGLKIITPSCCTYQKCLRMRRD